MPPSTARTICSSSRCHSYANSSGAQRTFCSSPASRQIGPESPKYIEFPQPPQQTAPFTRVKKGSLPVPRNIFINRSQLDKASPEFLAAVTPEPTTTTAPHAEHAARSAWKQRMAALRRRNLRESVVTLHERKNKMDSYLAKRGAQRQAQQTRLVNQPARPDEALTNPSVTKAVRDLLHGAQPGSTEADLEAKRQNIRTREAARALQRKDALHTLYMHAREFIITEEQLRKTLDETFGSDQNPVDFSVYGSSWGRSIWIRSPPKNTAEMLTRDQKMGGTALEVNRGYYETTSARIKKIAEELTGGKI